MKLKIKYILLVAVCATTLIQSCKKGDNYYVSPNAPSEISLPTVLSSLEVGTMNTYEGDIARTSSILIQQNVGALFQAQDPQVYSLIEDQFNNQWTQVYQSLENAKLLLDKAGTKNPHYSGIAKVLSAMNWGILTDMWGDVPYTEALKIEEGILSPKFDNQQVVLTGILAQLDEAIADLSTPVSANLFHPGSDDIIFSGDVALWTKTAYTLKARYLNRYSKKSTYNPAEILTALSNGISSNGDNCLAIHGGGSAANQWYAFENTRGYIVSAKSYIDSLLLRPTDQRVGSYFSTNDSGLYVGSPIDVTNDDGSISRFGSYIAGSESRPFPLVTYAEAKFIEAEVLVRTSAPNANDALNEAIKASCSAVTSGVYDGVDIATYTATNTDLSRVMYEKWLGMYGQVESYNDYRRTGYPMLTPNPSGLISTIPARFPIPQQERVNNPNAPTPALTAAVWWAQ